MINRIVFGTPIELEPPEEYVPTHFLADDGANLTQQWQHEQILVFCQEQAYQEMHRHAREDQRHECTGVLIGQVFRDPNYQLPFVIISRALRINTTSQSGTHVTVDVDVFRHTRELIEQNYSGMILVGWYHTHPSMGIFLSSTDMQVTRGLFNASWHIAIVIDPVNRKEGAFVRQGEHRVAAIIRTFQKTPIVWLMARYRQACEQLEADQRREAHTTLREIQRSYDEITNTAFRDDLRLWAERGGYRDVTTLLEHSTRERTNSPVATPALLVTAGMPHPSTASAEPVILNEVASLSDRSQQIQDLLRAQDKLINQVQHLASEVELLVNEVRDRKSRGINWLELFNLMVLLGLALLVADIYLR